MQDNVTANPYAAPTARIEQPLEQFGELNKASRGTRLGAYLLDAFIVGVWAIPFYVATFSATYTRTPDAAPGMFSWLGLMVAVGLVIYNFVLLHRSGQTIAKKWLGIRIVRNDGSRAGLGRIFALRMLVPGIIGAIPFVGIVFTLVDALFIFGDERRTLHDRIADTIVVDA
jgi:uncharacterized RDD family membrane protein YckC